MQYQYEQRRRRKKKKERKKKEGVESTNMNDFVGCCLINTCISCLGNVVKVSTILRLLIVNSTTATTTYSRVHGFRKEVCHTEP